MQTPKQYQTLCRIQKKIDREWCDKELSEFFDAKERFLRERQAPEKRRLYLRRFHLVDCTLKQLLSQRLINQEEFDLAQKEIREVSI